MTAKTTARLIDFVGMCTTLYNTKTGQYISFEINEDEEEVTFSSDDVFLFSLPYAHVVTYNDGKEFTLYEDASSIWCVRPFYEVDTTHIILAEGDTQVMYNNFTSDIEDIYRGYEDSYDAGYDPT